MGGKGGGGTDYQSVGYSASQSGMSPEELYGSVGASKFPTAMQGWTAGDNARKQAQQQEAMLLGMMEGLFAEPEGGMTNTSTGPTYEEQLAAQQQTQGLNDRDTLFGSYLDAAGAATDYVNSEITTERSNAALMGVEYTMDDERKATRINDYFATLWGEGEQSSLEGLMGQWGNPSGFSGFTVKRGDGSKYAKTEASEKTDATSSGSKPITLMDEEEDVLGGYPQLLGA